MLLGPQYKLQKAHCGEEEISNNFSLLLRITSLHSLDRIGEALDEGTVIITSVFDTLALPFFQYLARKLGCPTSAA